MIRRRSFSHSLLYPHSHKLHYFRRSTVIHLPLHGFIWNQHNDQLPVGLLGQLLEHCTCIAEVMVTGLIFQALFSLQLKLCSLLRRSLSHSLLYPQFTYMIFIYSQSFICILNGLQLSDNGIVMCCAFSGHSNFTTNRSSLLGLFTVSFLLPVCVRFCRWVLSST